MQQPERQYAEVEQGEHMSQVDAASTSTQGQLVLVGTMDVRRLICCHTLQCCQGVTNACNWLECKQLVRVMIASAASPGLAE